MKWKDRMEQRLIEIDEELKGARNRVVLLEAEKKELEGLTK